MTWTVLGLGGMLGASLRYYLGRWVSVRAGTAFPWGTWIINLTGSLLLGILFALHNGRGLPDWVWNMFGTGFCGAYTTFSTFGYETSGLLQQGKLGRAAAYVGSSVALGIGCAWLGIRLAGG